MRISTRVARRFALLRKTQDIVADDHWCLAGSREQQCSANCVRNVVVLAASLRVGDGVSAGARRSSLKSAKLRGQPRQVEQLNLAGVQHWQHVTVNVGRGVVGNGVFDPMRTKWLADELTAPMITGNFPNAICLKQTGKFGDYTGRGEPC